MNEKDGVIASAMSSFPVVGNSPAVNYHTDYDSGHSHSSLELFRESPAKYAATRVFRTIQPDLPTSSMKVGQALHSLMFEYDKECQYAMRFRAKQPSRLALWFEPCFFGEAKIELTEKEVCLVAAMWTALFAEPDAWNLLFQQPGRNENVFFTPDHPERTKLKCKPDRVLENGLVVDLKTVDGPVDPSSWSRCLSKWGYHRQAAFYLDVLALTGQNADMFVFVAVSKDPPHEIGIYVLPQEDIEDGRRENEETLRDLAECRRSGVWKHEWQGRILTVGRPRWAKDR
jgi:hypothetical protein